jgi:recombination protein RecA
MSQALRKLAGAIHRSNAAVIFTNQLRHKIGVMFGSPETTSGGMALKFYASVRMDIRRIEAIKNRGEVTGNRTRVRIKKNKVAPPFREAEFDIMYNEGVSRFGDILDMGVGNEIIDKRGSYYFYEDERIGQGREQAKQSLRENADMALEIENAVRAEYGLPFRSPSDHSEPVPDPAASDEAEDQEAKSSD